MINETHDPALTSWVESANAPETDFPIQNLPYATFRKAGDERSRVGVAIGDQILDVTAAMGIASLMELMPAERSERVEMRRKISRFLSTHSDGAEGFLVPASAAELLLPCVIGDYTDFYASIHHATNVGSLFRPDNPLLPNYKWVPIAYHGRASSVVTSGSPVRRPWGQIVDDPVGPPRFAPSARLDYELEVGAFIGPENRSSEPIPIGDAEDHIFGVCLLNDWSARDIQSWEYQPLGPFLSKNFATSISPWIVTMEALEPFRRAAVVRPETDPQPLPYLQQTQPGAFAITLEVLLRTPRMNQPLAISRSDFSSLYWTLGQMVAHHTSGGCPMRTGDLLGSGTVSGPEKQNRGCLLELTRRGAEPVELPGGERRSFLEDGDEVTLRGWCDAPGYRRIGLGQCWGNVVAALSGDS
jgi:fumarylacetoacetase